jgi:putative sigma-54 modulation protein
MADMDEIKAPFAEHTSKHDKRRAGRTNALATQLEIRSGVMDIDPGLRAWIYERTGRQLGKFAQQIERIQVRFGDENGPKGGLDKCCLVHVILSKLPPVIVEVRGETEQQAFDLAASRTERAVRRNMEKHGFSTHHRQHKRHDTAPRAVLDGTDYRQAQGHFADGQQAGNVGLQDAGEEGLIGAREGHRSEQVQAMVSSPLRTKAAVQGPKEVAARASARKY